MTADTGHAVGLGVRPGSRRHAFLSCEELSFSRNASGQEDAVELSELGQSGREEARPPHCFPFPQMWQKIEAAEWRPQTYLELEGLPCILIFSGTDPHGESLPR